MDFVQDFLKENGTKLIGNLVGKFGFSAEKAGEFLPQMIKSVTGMVTGGKLDVSSLLGGGGVGELVSKLDIGALASSVGIEKDQAEAGVKEVGPSLISSFKGMADSPEKLLSMLGGDKGGILGSVGKLAGDLFNK